MTDYFTHTTDIFSFFFFFNDPPTTEISTLSLHDALPISHRHQQGLLDIEPSGFAALSCLDGDQAQTTPTLLTAGRDGSPEARSGGHLPPLRRSLSSAADRKSTRLNSSHLVISYAVFCLKK